MANILVIAGHGNFNYSTANKTLLAELEAKFPNAEVRRLSELYPDFNIDVAAEQAAILKADVIVLAFPLNWYFTPAILKKWMDDVLLHGFAYGTGAQMGGKKLVVAYTTAGVAENYLHNNADAASETSILAAFKSTAALCGMEFVGAFVENGYTPNITGDAELAAQQVEKSKAHTARLIEVLEKL